ncbi:hypothetical protein ES703_87273 [subsurface metagenome]
MSQKKEMKKVESVCLAIGLSRKYRLDFSLKYGIKGLFIRIEQCQKNVKYAERAPSLGILSVILIRLRRRSGSRICST